MSRQVATGKTSSKSVAMTNKVIKDDAQIVFDRVSRFYSISGGTSITALHDLSFQIHKKEIVSFVGKTGCGKSTTFRLVTGLEPPSRGRVLVDGSNPHTHFEDYRSKFGMVFQTDRLLEWRTTLGNVTVGLEILGYEKDEREAIGRRWLQEVGLEGYEDAYPHQLSGGMRQRVAISRAFSMDPTMLLCDEAFGHLDRITAEHLRQVFRHLVQETGKTALVITHDIVEALELGHRIVVLGEPAHDGLAAAPWGGRIYVIGGGPEPGASRSNVNEVFTPP